jgi:hypothetical protein
MKTQTPAEASAALHNFIADTDPHTVALKIQQAVYAAIGSGKRVTKFSARRGLLEDWQQIAAAETHQADPVTQALLETVQKERKEHDERAKARHEEMDIHHTPAQKQRTSQHATK